MKKTLLIILLFTSFKVYSTEINISPLMLPAGLVVINTVFETPIKQLKVGPSAGLSPMNNQYTLGIRVQYHFNPTGQSGVYFSTGAFPIFGLDNGEFHNTYQEKSAYFLYALGYDWKTNKSNSFKLGVGMIIPRQKDYDPDQGATSQILSNSPWPIIELQYGWVI